MGKGLSMVIEVFRTLPGMGGGQCFGDLPGVAGVVVEGDCGAGEQVEGQV